MPCPCPRQEPAQGVCEDVQSCGIALGLSVGLGLAVGLGCPFLSPYRFLTGFLRRLGQHREVRLYLGKVLLLQTEAAALSAVVAAFPWHRTSSPGELGSCNSSLRAKPSSSSGKAELCKASAFTHSPDGASALELCSCRHIPAGSKKRPWSCAAEPQQDFGISDLSPRLCQRRAVPGGTCSCGGSDRKAIYKEHKKKRKEFHVFHPNIWLLPWRGRFLQRDPVGERLVEELMPDPRILL